MNDLTIAIIGAGYSGLSLALNLYRFTKQPIRIILCELRKEFALGAAYSTLNPSHLLNVTASDMSAFDDKEDHFVNWLKNNPWTFQYLNNSSDIAKQYVPRFIYGRYLQSLLTNVALSSFNHIQSQIKLYQQEVINIQRENNIAKLTLANSEILTANKVILAYGNLEPKHILTANESIKIITNPWNYQELENIPRQSNVLIAGTGLTMIDTVLSLADNAHTGKIYAISRRGLLPQVHLPSAQQFNLDHTRLPKNLLNLMRYLRQEIKQFGNFGGDWRAVMNSLRPYTKDLWQQFSLSEKKRFLRHAVPYWDTHRHRIAPQVADRISDLQKMGKLQIIAGKIINTESKNIYIKLRGKEAPNKKLILSADYIINCTGPKLNYNNTQNPLLHSLLEQGLLIPDSVGVGVKIAEDGALIDKTGTISNWLFTLGPTCKGLLWECTAIPDIRIQSKNLALKLLSDCFKSDW